MKKIIAIALAAVMVLAFAACAKQNSENGTTTPSDDQKGQPQSALEILEKVWSKYSTDEKFPATGGSEKNIKDMMTSQFRSGRGKTRKREISRDFSRFFDPAFFRSFIDSFCPFRCCVRTRTHEKGFLRLPESNRLCGWIRTCESAKSVCYQFVESLPRSAVFFSKLNARYRLKNGKIYVIIRY